MQFERGEPQKSFSWYMTLCGQRERKINAGNPGGGGELRMEFALDCAVSGCRRNGT